MLPTRSAILGISHLYGEAGALESQLRYWKAEGLEEAFFWDLPVSDEKRAKLLSHPAESVRLHYLRWKDLDTAPGLELLRHRGAPPVESADPLLSLFLRSPIARERRDPQGNRVVAHPDLRVPVTVVARVPDPSRAGILLETLGFAPMGVEASEAEAFGFPTESWVVQQPLFPKRSFRITLVREPSAPERPPVDRPGLSGLSLWTPSLEEAGRRLTLEGHQRIEDGGAVKDVAFHCGSGLLLEFLQATRRGGT